MDIIVLLIWLMGLIIAHILLLKFLEMRKLTSQLVEKFSLGDVDITHVLKHLGIEQNKEKEKEKEDVEEEENMEEENMEEELMNYVYNYQSPELDENDKKITIDEVTDLSSRLTPTDASNKIASYSCDENTHDFESYNEPHDRYTL